MEKKQKSYDRVKGVWGYSVCKFTNDKADLDYVLFKYNNGHNHQLDKYNNKQEAIEHAKALHHPDWPCWQGIYVIEFGEKDEQKVVFDTNKQG